MGTHYLSTWCVVGVFGVMEEEVGGGLSEVNLGGICQDIHDRAFACSVAWFILLISCDLLCYL